VPSKNIWLTDSVYPTSHHNPAQTGTSPIAGPLASQHLTTWDVKTIATTFISNPTMKRIGQDRIIFVSSVNGIAKVLATGEAFEQLSFLAQCPRSCAKRPDFQSVLVLVAEFHLQYVPYI
jgi:hypothetical protein